MNPRVCGAGAMQQIAQGMQPVVIGIDPEAMAAAATGPASCLTELDAVAPVLDNVSHRSSAKLQSARRR